MTPRGVPSPGRGIYVTERVGVSRECEANSCFKRRGADRLVAIGGGGGGGVLGF